MDFYDDNQQDALTSAQAPPSEPWAPISGFASLSAATQARPVPGQWNGQGRAATADTAREVEHTLCPDEAACARALICAIGTDDVDTLARIVSSGLIDLQDPIIPAGADPREYANPATCTGVKLPSGRRLRYFFEDEPPTSAGWTPLNIAVALGSVPSLALLAALGARPAPTTEALVNSLLGPAAYSSPGYDVGHVDASGRFQSLGRRPADALAMLQQVLTLFGHTVPLADTDVNPLTMARANAVDDALGGGQVPSGFNIALEARTAPYVTALASTAQAAHRLVARSIPGAAPLDMSQPPEEQVRAVARSLAQYDLADNMWLPIVDVLLDAGYSPDERTWVVPPVKRRGRPDVPLGRGQVPERDAVAAAVAYYAAQAQAALDSAAAAAYENDVRASRVETALQNLVKAHIYNAVLDAYGNGPR
ncbi:hypothetical protein pdul_cds_855 [Pandoravirus dulcis]|uniref:Uncharacterized protein n=1 Tax=Pandoravirus dulcis TaxID=1349409 RepID=S4VS10_9VIRU|nr:hypothetical protein pdul_cds_855 [Pandoravirus dulcis]AGO83072.1 hypothetical protein pdul_cds_855 [Pandoravirus dulcis]